MFASPLLNIDLPAEYQEGQNTAWRETNWSRLSQAELGCHKLGMTYNTFLCC